MPFQLCFSFLNPIYSWWSRQVSPSLWSFLSILPLSSSLIAISVPKVCNVQFWMATLVKLGKEYSKSFYVHWVCIVSSTYWHWASYLPSLKLHFLIHKSERVILFYLRGSIFFQLVLFSCPLTSFPVFRLAEVLAAATRNKVFAKREALVVLKL